MEYIADINDTKKVEFLGIRLGLSHSTLEELKKKELEMFALDVITAWLSREYNVIRFGEPSYEVLVGALRSRLVKCNEIAEKIEQDHSSN